MLEIILAIVRIECKMFISVREREGKMFYDSRNYERTLSQEKRRDSGQSDGQDVNAM